LPRAEARSQSACQLPVSRTQAADQHERQQQAQPNSAPSNAAFKPGQR